MPVIVMCLSPARVAASRVPMPADWQVRFLESGDEAEVIAMCKDADCIVSVGTVGTMNARIMTECKNLKLIQCLGTGFNQVDLAAAEERKIPVANTAGQNAIAVAEFTVAVIVAMQRRILESDAEIKAGNYVAFRPRILQDGLQEIGSSHIGLIGMGSIAQQVARIAGLLGASVNYYTEHRRPSDVEKHLGISYQPFGDLLADNDVVSLHVPLNEKTTGMIGKSELASMKAGSLFVNTSRGPVVDQFALAEALESGHLGGAAIDTFEPEPPDAGHPLLHLSPAAQRRLLLTPHTAGATFPAFRRMLAACVDNMERVLRGEPVLNQVNRT